MAIDRFDRRQALVIAAGSLVAGCQSVTSTSALYGTISDGLRRSSINRTQITRERIESLAYASIAGWFDGSPPAMLVLGEIDADGSLAWYSTSNQILVTVGPYITRMLGIDISLLETRFHGAWDRNLLEMVGKRAAKTTTFQAVERLDVVTESKFELGGEKSISIYGRMYRLRLVVEKVYAAKVHRLTNRYWVDGNSGFCWRSQQMVIPTAGIFNLEILKPAQV